jgi:hypothetical protein
MSIFNWIGDLFQPAADLVDDLHYSGEEKAAAKAKQAELKNILAQIEAQVATKTLDFQSKLIEANSKIAVAEQKHGNMLSKSWRPLCSLGSFAALVAMGTGAMEYNQFLATIFGSFLGVYTGARSWEKKK